MAVFIQKGGEDLFSEINTFKAIFMLRQILRVRNFFGDWLFREVTDRFAIQGHKFNVAGSRLHTPGLKHRLSVFTACPAVHFLS